MPIFKLHEMYVKKLLISVLALGMTACTERPQEKPKMLGLTGYNYTDRYIDGFSVNGQGGGNVLLSDDSAGGGKTACCIAWRPGTLLPVTMHVTWTYGERWNHVAGLKLADAESHNAEVELKGPIPAQPTLLVAHFYPDNTVQLEVAEDYPRPRLSRTELDKGHKP